MSMVALIPAKSTSQRIPNKNIFRLGDHPLMAYTIAVARECGLFDKIVVSTDSSEYAGIAAHYGASVPFLRPRGMATPDSPDIAWVHYTMRNLHEDGYRPEFFSILRVTSPFRTAKTITQAYHQFLGCEGADSIRAVEKCSEHPGKMWILKGSMMVPLLPFKTEDYYSTPWHSSQYQVLPTIYVQNASLEIARTDVLWKTKTISGNHVAAFLTSGYEGFDINVRGDLVAAKMAILLKKAVLPKVSEEPWGH